MFKKTRTLMGVSPQPLRLPPMCYFLNRYYVIIMFSAGAVSGGHGIVPFFVLPDMTVYFL